MAGLALAAAVWFAAGRIPRSLLSDEVGAGGMPRGLAALLAAVSALILVRALLARTAAGDDDGTTASQHARAVGIVAIGFAAILVAPAAGYIATTFLLIIATAAYYGAKMELRLAAVALGGAVALWALFAKALNVSMPAGLWMRLLP